MQARDGKCHATYASTNNCNVRVILRVRRWEESGFDQTGTIAIFTSIAMTSWRLGFLASLTGIKIKLQIPLILQPRFLTYALAFTTAPLT